MTIPSPVNLSWKSPAVIGNDCQSNENTGPVYRVSLSQNYPPLYFTDTGNTFLEVKNVNPGIWYWTVDAINNYYRTNSPDVWAFSVFQFSLFILNLGLGMCFFPTIPTSINFSSKWRIHSK